MEALDIIVPLLSEAMAVPVSTEVPAQRPQRMVNVALEADSSTPYLQKVTVGLTCWGMSDREARGIALSAVEALQEAALDHPLLSAAQLETMARDEWANTGQARYYAVVGLVINTDTD